MVKQKQNIVLVTIHQEGLPTIKMVTEAGLIGKIGLNSNGVGVCFNAIRAKGLDASRLPVHLGLRVILESPSAYEAVEMLEKLGMASSAHFLIADASGAIGLEFTSTTFARLQMDSHHRIYHSNHLLVEHPDVDEPQWLPDSNFRVNRMKELTAQLDAKSRQPSWADFSKLFEDEVNHPAAICRSEDAPGSAETLFNIVMDLEEKRAVVRLGRPCQSEETLHLTFQ